MAFTFQNLLRAQFRVHSFGPECCYLCVCRWNLCACYFPGPSNFTHTHTHIHKCTLDTNLAYTQNCVSNIVASSSLLPTNSLARHADAAAWRGTRSDGGHGCRQSSPRSPTFRPWRAVVHHSWELRSRPTRCPTRAASVAASALLAALLGAASTMG